MLPLLSKLGVVVVPEMELIWFSELKERVWAVPLVEKLLQLPRASRLQLSVAEAVETVSRAGPLVPLEERVAAVLWM